jgi:hypothetical protein
MDNIGLLTLIGTILGAVIAGSAMIINSLVSTWLNNRKEKLILKQKQFEKDVAEISQLYESCLSSLRKLIKDYGMATDKEWKNFYDVEIKLKLYSDTDIVEKFIETKNAIIDLSRNLPSLPEEFIPKFEDDDHRANRLAKRKEAEEARKQEANKLLPSVNQKFNQFTDMLRNNLKEKKNIENL